MEDQSNPDHLNSSMTDLMTSLMVIFILLLLVFVHRTAGKDAAVTDVLLRKLLADMKPHGFNEQTIRHDPHDKNAILVIVPDRIRTIFTLAARPSPSCHRGATRTGCVAGEHLRSIRRTQTAPPEPASAIGTPPSLPPSAPPPNVPPSPPAGSRTGI